MKEQLYYGGPPMAGIMSEDDAKRIGQSIEAGRFRNHVEEFLKRFDGVLAELTEAQLAAEKMAARIKELEGEIATVQRQYEILLTQRTT